MSEVSATGASARPSDASLYAHEVMLTDRDRAEGTVTVGGVPMSTLEAAQYVGGLERAAAMKEVSETQVQTAQKFLERLRIARDIKQAVSDQHQLNTTGAFGPGYFLTPEQAKFMNEDARIPVNTGEDYHFFVEINSVGVMTKDLREAAGLEADEKGQFVPPEDFVPYEHQVDAFDGTGTTPTGAKFSVNKYHGHVVVNVTMPVGVLRYEDTDSIQEDLSNVIDQISNDNTLHMSKMKNILSKANSAEEMVNSLMNQANEQRNQRISRYS